MPWFLLILCMRDWDASNTLHMRIGYQTITHVEEIAVEKNSKIRGQARPLVGKAQWTPSAFPLLTEGQEVKVSLPIIFCSFCFFLEKVSGAELWKWILCHVVHTSLVMKSVMCSVALSYTITGEHGTSSTFLWRRRRTMQENHLHNWSSASII